VRQICLFSGWSVKLLQAFSNTVIPGFSLVEIHDQELYISWICTCFEISPSLRRIAVGLSVYALCVCCTIVSTQIFPRCHGSPVTMKPEQPLSLHYTKKQLYKIHGDLLSMQAFAAGCALPYITRLKLQLGVLENKITLIFPSLASMLQRSHHEFTAMRPHCSL
jgi:hypothetical protein